jgi:hypothetical protein
MTTQTTHPHCTLSPSSGTPMCKSSHMCCFVVVCIPVIETQKQNSYPDGKVCMSSLHPSGDNEMDNETFDIRWKPINSVSSILNSVLLILQEPNFSSPANIDASVQWQRDYVNYKVRHVCACVCMYMYIYVC